MNARKVVICGNYGCGKTCLVRRIVYDVFDMMTSPTVMAEVYMNDEIYGNGDVILWDTAGQERYSNMNNFYYNNSSLVIICSENDMDYEKYSQMVDHDSIIRVKTKCDIDNVWVSGNANICVSAKNNANIQELKKLIANKLKEHDKYIYALIKSQRREEMCC